MTKEELLTPEEAAGYLKVPIQTIWRWCRNGDIPAMKIGKYWRIPENELNAFIKVRHNQAVLAAQKVDPGKENGHG